MKINIPPPTIKHIPIKVFILGTSLKNIQPLRVDHTSIEYSKGDTTAGDAIL